MENKFKFMCVDDESVSYLYTVLCASVWIEINRGRNFRRKYTPHDFEHEFATQVEFSSILQANLCARRMVYIMFPLHLINNIKYFSFAV